MKKVVCNILLIFLTLSASAQVSNPRFISKHAKGFAQNLVEVQINQEPLRSSLIGVMAINLKGDTLVWHQADKKLVPASTMKTITTGLALKNLGPDYRYPTEIAYSGKVTDGILEGDLYIIGHGDPTLGSEDSIATQTPALFKQWVRYIKDAGIHTIKGSVIGDGRYFNGPIENGDWGQEDLGTYYGAGGNGLCFYRNIVDINVAPGAETGDPISMSIRYPETPWITYEANCRTGEKDTGDQLYLFNTDLAFHAEIRGTLAKEHYPKKLECSNKFGALTCAYYFSNFLSNSGIKHNGFTQIDSYGRVGNVFCSYPEKGKLEKTDTLLQISSQDSLKVIGTSWSPELKQIAKMTNYRSDNFYAETLMRTLGKVKRGSADYSTCRKYYLEALKEMDLDTSHGIVINDGSGLSRKNYIAPEFFCRFLKKMIESEVAESYISTLASPGTAHYTSRLKNEPDSVRQRIFMKSGSMNGVRCFCGYIEPTSGIKEDTVIFSIMTNNCTASDWSVYSIIDQIIAAISYEN